MPAVSMGKGDSRFGMEQSKSEDSNQFGDVQQMKNRNLNRGKTYEIWISQVHVIESHFKDLGIELHPSFTKELLNGKEGQNLTPEVETTKLVKPIPINDDRSEEASYSEKNVGILVTSKTESDEDPKNMHEDNLDVHTKFRSPPQNITKVWEGKVVLQQTHQSSVTGAEKKKGEDKEIPKAGLPKTKEDQLSNEEDRSCDELEKIGRREEENGEMGEKVEEPNSKKEHVCPPCQPTNKRGKNGGKRKKNQHKNEINKRKVQEPKNGDQNEPDAHKWDLQQQGCSRKKLCRARWRISVEEDGQVKWTRRPQCKKKENCRREYLPNPKLTWFGSFIKMVTMWFKIPLMSWIIVPALVNSDNDEENAANTQVSSEDGDTEAAEINDGLAGPPFPQGLAPDTLHLSTVAEAGSSNNGNAAALQRFLDDLASPLLKSSLSSSLPDDAVGDVARSHPDPEPPPSETSHNAPGSAAASANSHQHIPRKIDHGTCEDLEHMLESEDFKNGEGPIGVILNKSLSCKNGDYNSLNGNYSKDGHFYETEDYFGKGGYGKVYYCKDISTEKEFVTKKISLERFDPREVTVPLQLAHENIVKLYGVIRRDSMVELLLEYVNAGTWVNLIYPDGRVCPPPAQFLGEMVLFDNLEQALKGLLYLHTKGFWHRDIKPLNIGMTDRGEVKIFDFGAVLHKDDTADSRSMTINYCPPEVLINHEYCDKMDIWALGCSMIFLLTGREVWSQLKKKNLKKYIAENSVMVMDHIPSGAPYTWRIKNLLSFMLHSVPKERWSASACLDFIKRMRRATPLTAFVQPAAGANVLPAVPYLEEDVPTPQSDAHTEGRTSGYMTHVAGAKQQQQQQPNSFDDDYASQREFYPGHLPIDI